MKVSITEDATMSLTRSEGGATVVREDAMVWAPVFEPAVDYPKSVIVVRPAVSLCLKQSGVNRNRRLPIPPAKTELVPIFAEPFLLVVVSAEQFFAILNKADQHYYRRPHQAHEEHKLQHVHRK
jgi:hypothetical protein